MAEDGVTNEMLEWLRNGMCGAAVQPSGLSPRPLAEPPQQPSAPLAPHAADLLEPRGGPYQLEAAPPPASGSFAWRSQ